MAEGATIKDWMSLSRFRNLAIGGATVAVGAFVANPNPWEYEIMTVVLLQVLSVSTFMLAGNVANDLRDIEIDRVSHPLRVLPSGRISIYEARVFLAIGAISSILCLLSGAYILSSQTIEWTPMVSVWILALLLMITYEIGPSTKEKGFIGNIVIGSMLGLVIIFGAASVGNISDSTTLSIAVMATFMGIAREIVKDVHDLQGDSDEGRRTLPMKIGAQPSRNFAYLFALAGVIAIGTPFILEWGELEHWMIILLLPALLKLLGLNKPLSMGEDAVAIKGLLTAMVFGLIGFLVISVIQNLGLI